MTSGLDPNQDSSIFPFERLPVEIQSQILSLLPITTLVVCKLVSRSWRSIISSPIFTASYRRRRGDLIFLLWRSVRNPTSVSAYLPSDDRWLNFHIPGSTKYILASGTFLLLSDGRQGQFIVVDPFSRTPLLQLPPVFFSPRDCYKVLALIQDKDTPSDFKILALGGRSDRFFIWIYDSRLGEWAHCPGLAQHYSLLKNAVYLDGLLFCLTCSPDRLMTLDPVTRQWTVMTLDPVTRQWTVLDLAMPAPDLVCSLLLVFEGAVYLTGILRDKSQVTGIGIWELDRSTIAWSDVAFMPEEYLAEFAAGGINGLHVVDCMGIICYCNRKSNTLTCDIAGKRWWRPQICDVPKSKRTWLGHAIEPYVHLLK